MCVCECMCVCVCVRACVRAYSFFPSVQSVLKLFCPCGSHPGQVRERVCQRLRHTACRQQMSFISSTRAGYRCSAPGKGSKGCPDIDFFSLFFFFRFFFFFFNISPVFLQPICIPHLPAADRLVGLVVRASASRAEGPGFESRLRRDFFGGRVIPVT